MPCICVISYLRLKANVSLAVIGMSSEELIFKTISYLPPENQKDLLVVSHTLRQRIVSNHPPRVRWAWNLPTDVLLDDFLILMNDGERVFETLTRLKAGIKKNNGR